MITSDVLAEESVALSEAFLIEGLLTEPFELDEASLLQKKKIQVHKAWIIAYVPLY